MALWGTADRANNAPKYQILAEKAANGQALFGNTTPGAFVPSLVTGVFAANSAEANGKFSQGWILIREGTGPLKGSIINAGGTGYANTDTVTFSGGVVNATANVTTNATGGITALSFTNFGSGFVNLNNTTVTITTSAGTTANIAPVLGGKAGRVMKENLVAIKITANNDSGTIPG